MNARLHKEAVQRIENVKTKLQGSEQDSEEVTKCKFMQNEILAAVDTNLPSEFASVISAALKHFMAANTNGGTPLAAPTPKGSEESNPPVAHPAVVPQTPSPTPSTSTSIQNAEDAIAAAAGDTPMEDSAKREAKGGEERERAKQRTD